MRIRLNRRVYCAEAVVVLALATSASRPVFTQDPVPPGGVVVEEVGAGSAGEKAGIRAGDVLLLWVRAAAPPANPAAARGDLDSPFDLADVELEEASRGEVTLLVGRDGVNSSVTLPHGAWQITVRPHLSGPWAEAYQEGKNLITAKETEKGVGGWRQLAAQAIGMKSTKLAAWILIRAGDTLTSARRWDEAQAQYETALEAVRDRDAAEPALAAKIWDAKGAAYEKQNDFAKAEVAYREVLAMLERTSPETLAVAATLNKLGNIARNRSDLAAAEQWYSRALAIREMLAPGSLDVARSLNNLGVLSFSRGDLPAAEEFFRRSLAIREQQVPGTLDVAAGLNALGIVAENRGEPAAAETFLRRSLAIRQSLAPGSLDVAASLTNLGLLAENRGDLAGADEFHRSSLAIVDKLAPDSLDVAWRLNNLGIVAKERGDLAAAEQFHRRSLAIKEKLSPDSLDVAFSLNNLGIVAHEQGDLTAAEDFFTRSLAIKEKRAPASLDVASSLTNLGALARLRNDQTSAEAFLQRSLAIHQKLAPDTLLVAESLKYLGDLATNRGERTAAERSYMDALRLRQRLAPGTTAEAEILYELGRLAREAGQTDEAARYLSQAIAALEAQTGRLGGAEEVRSGFAARYVGYYRDYVDVLLGLDRPAEAFQVLERSRARSLLAMLAERDLVFVDDLPAALARERALINGDYDRTQAAIARLNPSKQAAELDRLLTRLRELRDKREQVAQSIRKTSPRFASLIYPQPLDLAGARSSLDPGTVLLAYSVAKEKTSLFVVQPERALTRDAPPVSVLTLPIGEAALREKVAAFRRLIQRGAQPGARSDALVTAGQELFATLIEPARAFIAASDRVLISPDGPLHTLPFGALVQPSGPARYFIEWKPLHVVASATVYSELKKTRRGTSAAPAAVEVAAFGDPAYPPLTSEQVDRLSNPEVRATLRRGYALEPLPASRKEVEGIARLYGGRAATYLGDQATEERAKTIGKGARYLHFASHGLLDERFPLNSALALTIPERPGEGQANGLLQAWEIFEQMRIDADLVTLSACETGLGTELGGEGLLGLTRAFQYAGARTVLASLWGVGDDSTADLMTRFYGHLKAGKSMDEALRAAQLEMIRAGQYSHPFQWAAFQLIGDWK